MAETRVETCRRMHLTKLARTALLAALPLSALTFACGGGGSDKKVDADDWVADLCDAAVSFQKASDKAGEGFLDADFDNTKETKAAFKKSLEGQKKAQKDFRSDFDKIGQPDIEDGDKVVDAFHDQFKENDKLTDEIAKAVADISDKDDFVTEFSKIADDFDTPDFRAKMDDLGDKSDDVVDLVATIDDDTECSGIIFDQSGSDSTSQPDPTVKPSNTTTAKTPAAGKTPTVTAAKTTNEKWVSTVCVSLGNWIDDLQNANDKLDSTLNTAKDAAELKAALVDFMKTGQTETKNLQKEIGALKAPDVKDGPAIQKTFNDAMGQLVAVFDDLLSQSQKVSTSSLSQTSTDVDRISQGIGDAFNDVGATFDKIDSYNAGELNDLFDSRPECQAIQ
ncbi:MAG: hypothetical protein ABI577_06075 [bacterium]